jgi:hypothetical protein
MLLVLEPEKLNVRFHEYLWTRDSLETVMGLWGADRPLNNGLGFLVRVT